MPRLHWARHRLKLILKFQFQLQNAGVLAQLFYLVGDEVAHRPDHGNDFTVFSGVVVIILQAVGMEKVHYRPGIQEI